ncbi:diacylglycerol kinase (ATP) [Neisseria sp. HSC-16F19]|nr:diacylglycerol kinase [Neisseria sp. HSC-16F19]MCP2040291.1 diacylglycerol kinase (ATP) [Neisseria sp. HSC-16F19]
MNPNHSPSETDFATAAKGKTGIRRIFNAFGYSLAGLRAAWSEAAFRQVVCLNAVLLLLLWWLDFGPATQMMLVMASMISIMMELINTAIEAAVDHTSLARHPLAKRAKDAGSAVQLLALIQLALLWGMALWREYGWNVF